MKVTPGMILGAAALATVGLIASRASAARTTSKSGGGSKGSGSSTGGGGSKSPGMLDVPYPKKVHGIPFAKGIATPLWPVQSSSDRAANIGYIDVDGRLHGNGARRFGALRSGSDRYHAAVDLYAWPDDICVAAEAGTVSNIQTFFQGTYALLLCTNTGITLLYGEIKKDSWKEFGIAKGSKVQRGQKLCRVARASGGSHMLHFETYKGCVTVNKRWYKDKPPPSSTMNPTEYLLRARSTLKRSAPEEKTVSQTAPGVFLVQAQSDTGPAQGLLRYQIEDRLPRVRGGATLPLTREVRDRLRVGQAPDVVDGLKVALREGLRAEDMATGLLGDLCKDPSDVMSPCYDAWLDLVDAGREINGED